MKSREMMCLLFLLTQIQAVWAISVPQNPAIGKQINEQSAASGATDVCVQTHQSYTGLKDAPALVPPNTPQRANPPFDSPTSRKLE